MHKLSGHILYSFQYLLLFSFETNRDEHAESQKGFPQLCTHSYPLLQAELKDSRIGKDLGKSKTTLKQLLSLGTNC